MTQKRGRPPLQDRPEITPRTLTAREAAIYLGRTYDWFLRNRRQLEAERQFPAPLPIVGRYDRPAIDAWIDRQMQEAVRLKAGVELHRSGGPRSIEEVLDRRAKLLARGLLK